MRMELYEIFQPGEKNVLAERGTDADAELFHAEFPAETELVFRVFQGLKSGFYMGEQELSFLCELNASGRAGKQKCARGLFQLLDCLAYGRLADKELFGCPGNISGQGYRVKNTVQ